MMRMSCRECQSHLVAYLHNQLPPRLRRRVGQHVNACANCYAYYYEQRTVANELASSLPRVGQPNAPQLGRVWAAIQADMNRPQPVASRQIVTRYGVACLILVLALLLPWSLNSQQIALAVPQQPSAPVLAATDQPLDATDDPRETRTVVLLVTDPAIPAAETPNAPALGGSKTP